jgi:hypothetical protein
VISSVSNIAAQENGRCAYVAGCLCWRVSARWRHRLPCRNGAKGGWIQKGSPGTGLIMFRSVAAALIILPSAALAADQTLAPGGWDVTSTMVEMSVPGLPNFLARTMNGKLQAEHQRLSGSQGVEALIASDAKARCRVDTEHVTGQHVTGVSSTKCLPVYRSGASPCESPRRAPTTRPALKGERR